MSARPAFGADRVYRAPAIRQRQQAEAAAAAAKTKRPPPESDGPAHEMPTASPSASSAAEVSPPQPSNIERFIASTTLLVRAHYLPRSSLKIRGISENSAYYNLGDLWDSFKEWSAYGVGVPLVLNGTAGVVQYYVPFLSAIQIFVDNSCCAPSPRWLGEESDGDTNQDTSSDVSSESNSDRFMEERIRSLQNMSCIDQDGSSSDDGETGKGNQHRAPVFQYLEHDSPYGRLPLADKISALSDGFPNLKRYKSCDLLPSSWMSVAWYPIYRIPTGPTLQDLDACFLTFHSLSTQDVKDGYVGSNSFPKYGSALAEGSGDKLALPLLGLASYKFRGSIWTSNRQQEQQLVASLLRHADSWLCERQVHHPDYRFFLLHSTTTTS